MMFAVVFCSMSLLFLLAAIWGSDYPKDQGLWQRVLVRVASDKKRRCGWISIVISILVCVALVVLHLLDLLRGGKASESYCGVAVVKPTNLLASRVQAGIQPGLSTGRVLSGE